MNKLFRRIVCWIKGHEFDGFLERRTILAKIKCTRCDQLLCLNLEQGRCLNWDVSWDYEFERMKDLNHD